MGWWGFNETNPSATSTSDLSGSFGAANNGFGASLTMTYNNPGNVSSPGIPYQVVNQAGSGFSGMGDSNRAAAFYGDVEANPPAVNAGATGGGAQNANPSGTGALYRYDSGFSGEAWVYVPSFHVNSAFGGNPFTERIAAQRYWSFGIQNGNPGSAANPSQTGRLVFTTTSKADYFSDTKLQAGQWNQVGFSWSGNTTNFYINGQPAGTSTAANAGLYPLLSPTNETFNIGRRVNTNQGEQLSATIDEFVIWNAPRSASAFAASYTVATGSPPPPLPTPSSLVSVDFVYGDLPAGAGLTGDTTLAAGPKQNSSGLIYTGQSGAWNSFSIGSNNENSVSGSASNLVAGNGWASAVSFSMTGATVGSESGWKNQYSETTEPRFRFTGEGGMTSGSLSLRPELAWNAGPGYSSDTITWTIAGLQPNSAYNLTFFTAINPLNTGSWSHVANGITGTLDAENDWNWNWIVSDSAGMISGTFISAEPESMGLTGFQIVPEPPQAGMPLILSALAGWKLIGKRRRRMAGL